MNNVFIWNDEFIEINEEIIVEDIEISLSLS